MSETNTETKTEKKAKIEKPFDITKLKFKIRLERNASDEENSQYVSNGARGVQVMRGVDVMVPFSIREALRMAEDAKEKQRKYEDSVNNVVMR